MRHLRITLLTLLLTILSHPVVAQVFEYEGFLYTILNFENKTCEISQPTFGSVSGNLIIPPIVYDGDVEYKVEGIGYRAFEDNVMMTSISLPQGLTYIGDQAFSCCYGLTSISLPEGLISIGASAFYQCGGLTSVSLPEGLTSIGASAFSECHSLTSITLPEGLTSIGDSAFSICTELTHVSLPQTLLSIGNSAFSSTHLTSISLPEGITEIGNDVFCASGLKSISLPQGLTSIGNSAFWSCDLTSVSLPEGLAEIGDYAFGHNLNLTSISLPKGISTIRYGTFSGCSALSSISLPEGLTSIGDQAFYECVGLTSISLPQGVTSIGEETFSWCTGLTSVSLPEGLTSIGDFAFDMCEGLTSISLPQGVTSIGEKAFNGCTALTSISLPQTLTSIGSGVFTSCHSIKTIEYTASNPLENDIFMFEYPSIYENATLNMPNATLAVIEATDPWKLFHYIIAKDGSITKQIEFDKAEPANGAIVSSLSTISTWWSGPDSPITIFSTKDTVIVLNENGEEIATGDILDSDESSKFNINISPTVATSGNYRVIIHARSFTDSYEPHEFFNDEVILNYTVKNEPVAGDDFEYEGITYTILDADTKICKTKNGSEDVASVYEGEVVIPEKVSYRDYEYTVTEIGDNSFYHAKKLTSIQFPSSLTVINREAFEGCDGLTSVTFPEGLTTIDHYAFYNCTNLKALHLPASLKSIGTEAFYDSNTISTIVYDATTPIVEELRTFSDIVYENAILTMSNATLADIQETIPWNKFANIQAKDGTITPNIYQIELNRTEPENGATVSSLKQISTWWTFPNTINITNALTPYVINEDGNRLDRIEVQLILNDQDHSNITIVISPEITTNGNYQIVIPSGAITDSNPINKFINDEVTLTYTVQKNNDFEYQGMVYHILDADKYTCIAYGLKYEGEVPTVKDNDIIIPETVSDGTYDYTVTEISKSAFSGVENLISVTLPSSIESISKDAFANCPRLTSLVWKAHRRMQEDVVPSIDSPNLLVYVDSLKFAPIELNHNIVVMDTESGSYECQRLVIEPTYPFTPLHSFVSLNSSMTKEFSQTTPLGGCAGWETIVLPFDATSVAVSDARGELTPFSRITNMETQYPYWLYEADSQGEWKEAFRIQAGVPYLISMPNNEQYAVHYRISGPVTFSNPNAVTITPQTTAPYSVTWASGHQFRSLWLPLTVDEAQNTMGLNVGIDNLTNDEGETLLPGSAFHVDVHPLPLEAYVTRYGARKALPVRGGQSHAALLEVDNALSVVAEDGTIYLSGSYDRQITIFRIDGVCVKSLDMKAGETYKVEGLTKGIYIVAGHKIIMK